MKTQILTENEKRNQQLQSQYDPQNGLGCSGSRVAIDGVHLPVALMDEHPGYDAMTSIERDRLRIRYDFEFWCWRCVKIIDKMTGRLVPFVLNRPQRKLLAEMEAQRLNNEPVRIILLKARQWGGSTLVQVYIAWWQLVVYKGKNSIIVGHKRNSSFAIKNMLRNILANYPKEFLDEDDELKLKNVPDCKDIQEITGRECSICLTSSYSPDSARGLNLSFAHLSEVAFWNSNRNIDPNDLIRTVTGTIPLAPGTIIVMESTANGTNSFFYNEWQRAVEGKSAFKPVFVAWNEIEIYSKPLDDGFDLDKCDEYEQALWDKGCTLEQVNWYHEKRKEFNEHNLMKAEFPSDDKEAFENSVDYVFSSLEQERIKENITAPVEVDEDNLTIWSRPQQRQGRHAPREVISDGYLSCKMPYVNSSPYRSRYLAVLTIGHESDGRLPSVFSVWDMQDNDSGFPALAAQWSGNLPLNQLALLTIKWASRYDNALLVVENNDIEAKQNSCQQGVFVIDELYKKYNNLYYQRNGKMHLEVDKKVFSLMFYELILSARNAQFIDRDQTAADAVAKMIVLPNGRYYATAPEHQNLLLNRCETLYVVRNLKT